MCHKELPNAKFRIRAFNIFWGQASQAQTGQTKISLRPVLKASVLFRLDFLISTFKNYPPSAEKQNWRIRIHDISLPDFQSMATPHPWPPPHLGSRCRPSPKAAGAGPRGSTWGRRRRGRRGGRRRWWPGAATSPRSRRRRRRLPPRPPFRRLPSRRCGGRGRWAVGRRFAGPLK